MIIPRSETRPLVSSETHREYRIFIASPKEQAPPEGFPVIYLLDANATFGTVVEAIRMRCDRPHVTGVVPAFVVGIGYPTDTPYDRVRRTYDYTPATLSDHLPERYDGSSWSQTGGAEHFRRFLENDLKPAIQRDFPVNRGRQILMGHSLGSFFVLTTLMDSPEAFRSYVAISPSIWWDRQGLFAAADALGGRLRGTAGVQVALAVGEYEQAVAPWQQDLPNVRQIALRRRERKMVDNTREFAEHLQKGGDSYVEVRYDEFPGEDHASVVPAAISRALRFVLRPE